MPSTWPEAARTAQTIAARSYAAYRLRPGVGTFDVYPDTRSQVYRGVRVETGAANKVIADTSGQVLRGGAAVANALFHSTGGGATEHNENVFVSATGAKLAGPVSYLRGSPDRDANGVPYDAGAPYATWKTKTYTLAQLSAILAADPRTNVGRSRPSTSATVGSPVGWSASRSSARPAGRPSRATCSSRLFNAHRPAGDPPGAQHAPGARADPLTAGEVRGRPRRVAARDQPAAVSPPREAAGSASARASCVTGSMRSARSRLTMIVPTRWRTGSRPDR